MLFRVPLTDVGEKPALVAYFEAAAAAGKPAVPPVAFSMRDSVGAGYGLASDSGLLLPGHGEHSSWTTGGNFFKARQKIIKRKIFVLRCVSLSS